MFISSNYWWSGTKNKAVGPNRAGSWPAAGAHVQSQANAPNSGSSQGQAEAMAQCECSFLWESLSRGP